jgi:hypothetical protein
VAGNEALPVHSFLIRLEHFHTASDLFNILDQGLVPGSGVTVHEVNKLSDYEYRVSIHVAPRDKYAGQELATSLIEKALTDTAMAAGPVIPVGSPALDVPRDFFAGVLSDLQGIFRGVTSTAGGGIKDILGGPGLGTVAIVIGAVVVLLFIVSRGARSAPA